jgi:enoyl-CoA hydratase
MSVDVILQGPVMLVQLNRPGKLNALTREMMDGLVEAFTRAGSEPSVRAVVLTGAGSRAFCAGTDIEELARLDSEDGALAARRGQEVCAAVENCGVPVIAALNGLAAGGGCELALACHLRVAAGHVSFSLPEIALGLIPAYGGTQRGPRLLGRAVALELMLAGSEMSAERALRLGLVNSIVKPEELLKEALALADKISRQAPLAIRACLSAVTRGLDLPLAEGLALEAELFGQLFATEDVREGTRAFLEKCAPLFKGR